jgi:hypothetical protein
LETGIDDNQMCSSHNVSHHILVQSIDRETKIVGKVSKGLSRCLDLGTCEVSIALCKLGICLARFVVELRKGMGAAKSMLVRVSSTAYFLVIV